MEFYTIDLETITSANLPTGSKVDRLAKAIVANGGLVKPVVLRKTGFEQYELVDGALALAGAIAAARIDPALSEVPAMVISAGTDVSDQLALLA